ncbi:uncharacterized protein LY79DRAFT_565205 [Colletotrichum navitas]|uniref:Uncharacterized protein n=1 Tax=Colletotrichum navitas TaxID=681940 RepID=A0AAD8PS94_9PEZI|nr:uncharacterized protein LY79DRAFT_565205 [Colletotrichum navitas]KAK1574759.1 hypothetical protein LY79DRAFT_565205 [Colletotrichum navitas]
MGPPPSHHPMKPDTAHQLLAGRFCTRSGSEVSSTLGPGLCSSHAFLYFAIGTLLNACPSYNAEGRSRERDTREGLELIQCSCHPLHGGTRGLMTSLLDNLYTLAIAAWEDEYNARSEGQTTRRRTTRNFDVLCLYIEQIGPTSACCNSLLAIVFCPRLPGESAFCDLLT